MSEIQYQKDGADKIYNKLFEKGDQRYLLADEVGLGKTITAAEVIVRLAKKLQQEGKSTKIAYICSNIALANENIQKLEEKINKIDSELNIRNKATERISLGFLDFGINEGESSEEIQIYTITPSTTIKVSSVGMKEERAYAYRLICNKEENDWFARFCRQKAAEDSWEKEVGKTLEKMQRIENVRAKFLEAILTEWENKKKQIIEQFIEISIGGFPDFYSDEQNYRSYCILSKILEDDLKKGIPTKGIERLKQETIEKRKREIEKRNNSLNYDIKNDDIEKARISIKNINHFQYEPYIRAIKLGAAHNLKTLLEELQTYCKQNYIGNSGEQDCIIDKIFADISAQIGSYIEDGFTPIGLKNVDSQKSIEKSIDVAFEKTCYKECMIMARKQMVEISMDYMKMDLFIADEIQNYSDIFRSKSDSDYQHLIDRVIKPKSKEQESKVLMMSATPFRYHSIMNSLENTQKDVNADSEEDFNAIQEYLENKTDIYEEFKSIIKYLNSKFDIDFWQEQNKCKQCAVSEVLNRKSLEEIEEGKKNYIDAVKKQSGMLQNVNISRVERYMAQISSEFIERELEIPFDDLLIHEMETLPVSVLDGCFTDELGPGQYKLIKYEEQLYITKDGKSFQWADGAVIDDLMYEKEDVWELQVDEDGLVEICNSEQKKEKQQLENALRKVLSDKTMRLDYIKSTPVVFSFGQEYVSMESFTDQNRENILSYDRVHNYQPLFADKYNEDEGSQENNPLIYNARIKRLFEKLFDEEKQHKLLFIPPARLDVELKGVYKDKRGVSKRLFFSDYKMIPKSLSSLITYEAERRAVSDLKKKYVDLNTEIPLYDTVDSEQISPVLKISQLCERLWRESERVNIEGISNIEKTLFEYDKKTHIKGIDRKGSVYDYCCSRNEIFKSDNEKIRFGMAYYKYMCRKSSLRVILAYADEDENGKCINGTDISVYDKILKYGENGSIWDVLDEFSVYCKKLKGESFSDAFSRIMNINFKQIKANAKGNYANCCCQMNTDFATGHFYGDKGVEKLSPAKALENKMARFNSPFWPFQFISTSIGQEGFDFHAYCRKVVHWSLEFNPIKFEQREGRINRYQGYANRLKLAKFMKDKKIKFNGWEDAFEDVRKSQIPEIKELVKNSKGLFPDFVIGDIENEECRLERECYYYPYSFESHEFKNVLICVGYYRTLLGQTGDDKFEMNFHKFIEEIEKTGQIKISDYFIDLYPKKNTFC